MDGEKNVAGQSKRHSWMAFTTLYVAVLLIPILLYVFVYQGSRIDEVTMRNFRSLDTAAERIREAMKTMRKVAKNYSLGVDQDLLNDIIRAPSVEERTKNAATELKKIISEQTETGGIKPDIKSVLINQTCDGLDATEKCKSMEEVRSACPSSIWHCDHAQQCSSSMRISAGHIISPDCRLLRERDEKLYNVLQSANGGREIIGGRDLALLLDRFGIEVSMGTRDALDHPTRHLSMFFDSYFVASGSEDVIFSAGARHSDGLMPHHEGSPFVSIAKISDILSAKHGGEQRILPFAQSSDRGTGDNASLTGHSTVRTIDVNGVSLSVFIHPFEVDISVLEGDEEVSTWYVVGVVPRKSLAREAIRIRLGPAADATLAIVLLLAFLPILRFWSASNRSILSRFGIYGIVASSLGVAALATALGWSVVAKDSDRRLLDSRLKDISEKIHSRFGREAEKTIEVVEEDIDTLVKCGYLGDGDEIPTDKSDRGCPKVEKGILGKELLCASKAKGDERAMVQSAFLLNEEGTMAACMQYRTRQSQKLKLGFREYFTSPHVLELVERLEGVDYVWKRGPAVFQTIDSVVQGKKEVVVSFAIAGKDACVPLKPCLVGKEREVGERKVGGKKVGAAVVHMASIDDVVLEPYYYYAIIDADGETLLHSDDDRERVSNFFEDTSNDVGVQLAIESTVPYPIDTYYDGRPIRAHFTALAGEGYEFLQRHGEGGKPWTLVVYTKYRVIDGLSLLTVSLSVVAWSATTIFIFLGIAGLSLLRRTLGRDAILPAAIATSAARSTVVVALALIAIGLVWSYLWASHAWVVATLLPVLMTLFIYSLAWRRAYPRHEKLKRNSETDAVSKATLAFAAVLICFSVVPMVAWQSYFRGELNGGLDRHLEEERAAQIEQMEGAYRTHIDSLAEYETTSWCQFIKRHVVDADETCLDAPPVSMARRALNGPFSWLEPMVAHSKITRAMMQRDGQIRSGSAELKAVDAEIGTGLLVLVMMVGAALLSFLSYSSARAKLGHARRIVLLPHCRVDGTNLTEDGQSGRVKVILVTRSETEIQKLLESLEAKYAVHVADWIEDANGWDWNPLTEGSTGEAAGGVDAGGDAGEQKKPDIYVVRNLRTAIGRDRGEKLARELERKKSADMILCADVVPSYRIGPGTLDDADDEASMFSNEWMELTSGFEVRVLCERDVGEQDEGVHGGEAWETAIALEVRMHKDFEALGSAVKTIMAGVVDGKPFELRDMALAKFRGGALLKFKDIWSACSNDERLQIIALARGGAPNIRQHAAISSLANRGIVTTSEPIELTSKAFADFVNRDLAHDSLDEWRRRGHRDWWRVTWLPLVILAGLGLMFFLNSNPEAIGTLGAIFAALIAFVPLVTSLLRVGQSGLPIAGSGAVE